MNDEEQLIEQWATAAGWRVDSFTNNNGRRLTGLTPTNLNQVKAFASLVAAHEREAAAKLAEQMRPDGGRAWSSEQHACFMALTDCATAIRQRGSAD